MQYMIKGMQPPVPYMPMPRYLLEMPISSTAKIVYVVLLSRALISSQTDGWQDEQGRVYLYYTIDDLGAALHRGESAILDALAVLEKNDLIARERQGPGRANRIYVKISHGDKRTQLALENHSLQPQKTTACVPGKPRGNYKKKVDKNYIDETGGYETL